MLVVSAPDFWEVFAEELAGSKEIFGGFASKGKRFCKSTMGQDLQEVSNQVGEHRQIRLEYVQHI